MSPARKTSTLLGALAVWMLGATAWAHPVAQGALEVRIAPHRLSIRARIAVEQVFVESSLAQPPRRAESLDALWPAHGDYLLAHLFVSADGVPLSGRITGITPPAVATVEHSVLYDLEYDLAAPPSRITLRQNLLNEFTFAPGNQWEATFVVRIEEENGPAREALLSAARPLEVDCGAPGTRGGLEAHRLALDYVRHGLLHILHGWDHLLFMAALVLAVGTVWDLVKVVTAFTVAHTLTLACSALGWVRLPSQVVEPMIAASIVFVAAQNCGWPHRARGWTRLLVAFGFGLFHGLGFAGGLLEAMQGFSGLTVATAIAAFSVGVELGHQAVVLPVFGGMRILRGLRIRDAARARWSRAGSACIALAGVCYLFAALRG